MVLEVVAAPAGLDITVNRIRISAAGETDTSSNEVSDVVISVGTSLHSSAFAEVLRSAALAGAAAVVVKATAGETLSSAPPIAVLTAPADADWGQIYTLLGAAASSARSPLGNDDVAIPDLFSLADAMATAIGGATTIEDRQFRVVAYSSLDQPIDDVRRDSILGRGVPSYVMEDDAIVAMYRTMWSSDDVVRLPSRDDGRVRSRMGVPMRAGGAVVGSIWVVEGDRPFDTQAEATLREASKLAALRMIQHLAADDPQRRQRSDAVRSLLEGRGGELGSIAAADSFAVITFAGVTPLDPQDIDAIDRLGRLSTLVAFHCEALDSRSVAVILQQRVWAIVPLGDRVPLRRVRDVATEIVRRAEHTFREPVFAGIGGVARATADLAESRWQAAEVHAALVEQSQHSSRVGANAVGSMDDMQDEVAMRHLRTVLGGDHRLRSPRLIALHRHDLDQHTDYVATLGAYFAAFGDIASAAAAMNVHSNTLRYRLKRIGEIAGIDLDRPVDRFMLELAWRLGTW